MEQLTSTALVAGARKICADSAEHALYGMGSVTQQPPFRPVSRRAIMAAVNTCGRDLGIRQAAVVVLDALLSFLPCRGTDGQELPVSPTTLLTVYASNETLCFRAKGLTDRQLRRHLETLEKAGLIRRRDSANGKRFPVMQHGKTIGAFGLDLSPLFARSEELLALALRRREEAEEMRGLRAQILHLRAACLELNLSDSITVFVDSLRNLVRRTALTLVEARAALAQLTGIMSESAAKPPSEPALSTDPAQVTTDQTPASDGQNDRHTEPKSDTKKSYHTEPARCWANLTEVSAFYPEPCSDQDARLIAFEFGQMLRINQNLIAKAVSKLGLWGLLKLEDRMAKQIGGIMNPDAYLQSVLRV
jgi:replication initiation protein RepC